jgi:hypothetical protein
LYTLFFVFLGSSAALWGGWLERAGPRKAGVVSAICWCGGIVIAAVGVVVHQLWIMWLGGGVIGGIGLGLGYISPVSTLVRWFPDRRGMATGMAIMGFGGGAMIGAPLANLLMTYFRTPSSGGRVADVRRAGGDLFRVHDERRVPLPRTDFALRASSRQAEAESVHYHDAIKTRQFWLIWAVLCLNVSAGIGVIGMASPMLQEIFGASAAVAAGFTGAHLALQHRRAVLLGVALRSHRTQGDLCDVLPAWHRALRLRAVTCTRRQSGTLRPRRLRDRVDVWRRFRDDSGVSRRHVRHAVRRRDSRTPADGVVNRGESSVPVLVNYIREAELAAGVPTQQLYDVTMYVLSGLLVLGLVANAFVKSQVPESHSPNPTRRVTAGCCDAASRWELEVGRWKLAAAGGMDGRRDSARVGNVGHADASVRAVLGRTLTRGLRGARRPRGGESHPGGSRRVRCRRACLDASPRRTRSAF